MSSVSPLKVVVFLRLLFLRELRDVVVFDETLAGGTAESFEGTVAGLALLIISAFKINVLGFS